jgi:hypothetical protein
MRKYSLLTILAAFVALGIVSPIDNSVYSEDTTLKAQETSVSMWVMKFL